jgi:REP element-mobilizing transposase RayT
VTFKPFDLEKETSITWQTLPHWRQMGVTYFVTSRLADSIPHWVVQRWEEERRQWLLREGVDSDVEMDRLSSAKRLEFKRTFTAKWHRWLDIGYGNCVLKESDVAQVLIKEITRGHPIDYTLDAWVLMPNHFHALVNPSQRTNLSSIQQRWKGASAMRINHLLKREGQLWQKEAFDHIVRNSNRLNDFRRYIAENPGKARLREGEYVLGFGRNQITPTGLLDLCSRDFSP